MAVSEALVSPWLRGVQGSAHRRQAESCVRPAIPDRHDTPDNSVIFACVIASGR
jgi:hypothetical protein